MATFVFGWQLGDVFLFDKDEPRYAAAAFEMLRSDEWIVPSFNWEPRYAKPILFYWLEMFSFKAFGVSEFSARLPSMLFGIGLVTLVYRFAGAVDLGFKAALILMTSVEIFVLARMSIIDMTLTFWIAAALVAFWKSLTESRYLWFVGVAVGFGLLTKGPVALLVPGMVAVLYLLSQRSCLAYFRNNAKYIVLCFGLMLVIALPWYLAVHFETAGDFSREFFLEDNFGRFMGEIRDHKARSIFYYLVVVLVGAMPWTFAALFFLVSKFESAKRSFLSLFAVVESDRAKLLKFCLIWFLVVLVFFSAAGIKLPNYIASLFVPLAVLLASVFESRVFKTYAMVAMFLFVAVGPIVLKRVSRAKQSAIVDFARSVPPEANLVAFGILPQSLVFYAARDKNIPILGFKELVHLMASEEPVYLVTRPNKLEQLETSGIKFKILARDKKYIFARNF